MRCLGWPWTRHQREVNLVEPSACGCVVTQPVTVITTASPASIRKQSPFIHQLPLIPS